MEAAANSQDFLSTIPAGKREQRLAGTVLLVSVIIFAALAPYAKTPLRPVWGFIPCYESMLVTSDIITAVLLFGQIRASHSKGMLALACGYLFTATMTVLHALTFPGLFAPGGLLGAGPQTTAWLYMFWHGGFPLFVLAYAGASQVQFSAAATTRHRLRLALAAAAGSMVLAGLFAVAASAGHDLLPVIMRGNVKTPAMFVVAGSVWLLSAVALFAVWRKPLRSTLDLWLMTVMCAWLIDIALAALLNGARFDLGFYAGRIYGLLAANFVLIELLVENGVLYANLLQMARELRELSARDGLTGLANRRTFDAALDTEWRRALRNRTPLSLLMIDLDFFKCYNDAYGHLAGDACLRAVGGVLAATARRAGDVPARYGGEEFALLLPLADEDEAYRLGQQICRTLAELALPHKLSAAANHVTASIGVACVTQRPAQESPASSYPPHSLDPAAPHAPALLVEVADRALYATKTAGRNNVSRGATLWIGDPVHTVAVAE